MSRRALPTYDFDPSPPPSKCAKVWHCFWKMLTCMFSHAFLVTLVVAYCILGAFTFEHLEAENERQVKRGIMYIRGNVTDVLWQLVRDTPVLVQDNWTQVVVLQLKDFETDILKAMKQDGWDGDEDDNVIQWTFAGALFYSIIVITTIGYGHIAPKTQMGKVTTIFYAILGIPLMLLCLSNIGDIMASSFRFVYWRVCCYVCTRKPKKKRRRGTMRQTSRPPSRSRPGSLRQTGGMQTSLRSGDSGFSHCDSAISHSYSDADFRYNDEMDGVVSACPNPRSPSRLQPIAAGYDNSFDETQRGYAQRGYSLDRRARSRRSSPRGDPTIPTHLPKNTRESWRHQRAMSVGADRTPVLCNKYALNDDMYGMNEVPNRRYPAANSRFQSMPRLQKPPQRCPSPNPIDGYMDDEETGRSRSRRREKPGPSPRIMSPMGLAVNRQQRPSEEAYYSAGEDSYAGQEIPPARPVPIWLCVFLVISYIIAGAFLFSRWEKWSFLDSVYFCFITLTTIGFGDFVPAQGVKANSEISIALCSLYLLFGIALLAMSFNLVQEEVIANVKSVAKRLGILKEDAEDIDD